MPKVRYQVKLSEEERAMLSHLANTSRGTPQKVKNALILLAVDCGDFQENRNTDERIAEILDIDRSRIYRVKRDFVEHSIEAALTGRTADRFHRSRKLDGEQEAKLVAISCSTLPMVANQASFIVFDGAARTPYVAPQIRTSALLTVNTPWTIRFSEGVGAPEKVTFPTLKSLTESDDPGVKYFSGTASYTTTVNLSAKQLKGLKDVAIDMGDVENMADVFVNGQHVGFIWKAPFCLEGVLSALKAGNNTIEIRVTNPWPNRLIGDAQPDAEKKYTYSSGNFYRADAPLRPAGLIGPVKLIGIQ